MALVNVDIGGGNKKVVIDENTVSDGDVLQLSGFGTSSEVVVDGVTTSVGSLAGINAGSSSTFTVINGGDLRVDQGIVGVSGFNKVTFGVVGDSSVTLKASDISVATGVLNEYHVDFSGSEAGSFTFQKGAITLADNNTFHVTGMQAGDQLNLGGGDWKLNEGSWLFPEEAYRDGALHLTQGDILGGSVNARIEMTREEYEEFMQDPDAYLSGGTYTQVCFAAGTMIATPDGEVAVETLSIGDLVMTAGGEQVPVKWIGRQTISRLTGSGNHAPVRIRESALAAGIPHQDLVLTASHGVIVDDLVINAGALVNHDTIDYVPSTELPDAVTYYHIETDSHEVILANGTAAETYIDYVDRQAFDNYAEYVALYGIETRVVEMPRHRISSRRLLPLALRARLGIEDVMLAAKTA